MKINTLRANPGASRQVESIRKKATYCEQKAERATPEQRDVKNEGRSDYVYENKRQLFLDFHRTDYVYEKTGTYGRNGREPTMCMKIQGVSGILRRAYPLNARRFRLKFIRLTR
jgi:hypothetical protein